MERIEVEAVEDRSKAEGGYAMLMIRNVASLPADVTFHLRPIDGGPFAPEARQLFEREHAALSVSETEDGVALSIGPDLASTPYLLPGTPVELVIAEPGLRGEFLWPAIAPAMRAKRRNIMTRRMPGDVTPPAPTGSPATTPAVPVKPVEAATTTAQPRVSRDAFDFSEALARIEPKPGASADAEVEKDPTSAGASVTPPPARKPIIITSASRAASPEAAPASVSEAASPADNPTGFAAANASAPAEPAAVPATLAKPTVAGGGAGWPTQAENSRPELDRPPPTMTEPPHRDAHPAGDRKPAGAVAVAGVTAVALALASLVGMRLFDVTLVKRSALGPTPAPAPIVSPPPATALSRSVYDVFAAGPISPRGMNAETVSPAKALQLAHALLHGKETERDAEEGIYWLKRYLAATSGTEHARIALTQLGSAYAQPVRGARDMASARIAWELAGALGDTVAMCFLGAVYENGIGLAADRTIAASWYQRAAAAGGSCASAGVAGAPTQR